MYFTKVYVFESHQVVEIAEYVNAKKGGADGENVKVKLMVRQDAGVPGTFNLFNFFRYNIIYIIFLGSIVYIQLIYFGECIFQKCMFKSVFFESVF